MTRLYRIRRRNDTELRYLFIKAETPEVAAEQFAGIARTFIDGEPINDHETFRFNVGNGYQIEVRETSIADLIRLHPALRESVVA